ncbi:UvrD-helicase domain-containing protein [Bacillus wiedmannii]|uniref:UvrD-helicase domain-containing protein n=1 Tax=Bacillus wiedmannii TaxID=1890302 RepID=UPI0021D1C855|nr:ATP-dependent helicase [Bacillus wiedmannii]MCU5094726.1 ATP-dependent helicase [Bacillus wiedmannii]
MRHVNAEDWKPVDDIVLEENALKAVISDINTLIVAGPGAGKTELLAQRACYLLQTNICTNPQKILAISFKKDAAENLAERVNKRCDKELASRFVSKTFDSFAKNILDNFLQALPEEYKPQRQYLIATPNEIREAFELAGLIPAASIRPSDLNKILSDRMIETRLPISEQTTNEKLTKKTWEIMLKGKGEFQPKLSFQMISRLAEYIIRTNPLIVRALRQTYSHVFLDEFQDTTSVQYALLKACFYDSDSIITAVGDNKQRIMLWAGAKKNAFEAFKANFKAKELRLIMNHRSAPRLIQLQKVVYNYLHDSHNKIQPSNRWNEDDGVAQLWKFPSGKKEAEVVAKEIQQMIETEKLNPREICILVKQRPDQYGAMIINQLSTLGIKARSEAKYQDFLKEDIIHILLNSIYCALTKDAADSWIYIVSLSKKLHGYDVDTDFNKITTLITNLNEFLREVKSCFEGISTKKQLDRAIWRILDYFNLDAIRGLFPKYQQGLYLDELVINLIDFIWEEYMNSKSWLGALENLWGLNSIPIMTIHKSKGLEYNTVIFLGLEDSAFWNYSKQKEEDTCAFFVALSRAKHRIIFTFASKRGSFNTAQTRKEIKDFYDILTKSKVVDEINYSDS